MILVDLTHISKAMMVKFGATVWTWGSLPHTEFCKIDQLHLSLRGIFLRKIWNFHDFELWT